MRHRDREAKIQALVVEHLLSGQELNITLPTGFEIELGLSNSFRRAQKLQEDYCYVKVSNGDRNIFMDTFNQALEYKSNDGKIVFVEDNRSDSQVLFSKIEIF